MFSRLLRLFRKENGDQGETSPSKKEAALLSCKKGRLKSFWERHSSTRQTSSQNSTISNWKEMTRLEELKLKIKKMSFEEEEISQMLNLYNYHDLNYRMNIEFDIIKRNHEKTIMNIQKMTESVIDAMEKYKDLIEENYSYSTRHCQLLRECSQLKDNVRILLQSGNRNLLVEQSEPQVSYGEEKSFCDEANKNIYVPGAKHQQNPLIDPHGRSPGRQCGAVRTRGSLRDIIERRVFDRKFKSVTKVVSAGTCCTDTGY
uniref:uncharacterized protein LOC117702881 n=1 Tax=Arvicanthis niloticus TaxID=61156 RepID=UPI001486F1B2|nr:uncharacterized protein LOC117702881 [Arvicanthis niloticus]